MNNVFLIALLSLSCAEKESEPTLSSNHYTQSENVSSLHKSTASLDRMLVTTESMIADMDKMNKNLDAIFKAVTKCENEHDCEVLKQAFVEQAAAEQAQREQ